jgi:polyisoprenyl-phosphate glycosyltransferase
MIRSTALIGPHILARSLKSFRGPVQGQRVVALYHPVEKMQVRSVKGPPKISVVVPVYKEEANIRPFLARIKPVLEAIGDFEIIFCLDPSPDNTEAVIAEEAQIDSRVALLVFNRRYGQPAATLAGLLNCSGETCAVIDVDLQDPPELVGELYAKLREGYDVVYAQRRTRQGETLLKRVVARLGYRVINSISDVPIPRDTGDFRIVTRRVIEELRWLPEKHGFLRGLIAVVGLRQTAILYERSERFSGTGNYNRYFGSLKIGFNGVFGFSTFPLSLMLWTGFAIAVISALLSVLIVVAKLFFVHSWPVGVPTITVLVLFMGGIQLLGIGVLGEYIGRIYDEVRGRPQFVVDRAHNLELIDRRGPGSGVDAALESAPP